MPMYLSDCSPRFSWLQLTPGEPSVCKCTTRYTGGVHTQHTVCGVCTHSTHCVVYVLPPLYLVSVRNDTHHWVPGVHTTRYPVSITTRQAPPPTGVPVYRYPSTTLGTGVLPPVHSIYHPHWVPGYYPRYPVYTTPTHWVSPQGHPQNHPRIALVSVQF